MKKLVCALMIALYFVLPTLAQVVTNAPKIPNVSIQRLRSDAVNFAVRFQSNGVNMNSVPWVFRCEISETTSGIVRQTLTESSGISQLDSSTVFVALSSSQVAALTKDVYLYRLYTTDGATQTTRMYGSLQLVKGVLAGSGATLNTAVIVVNYTTSGSTTISGGTTTNSVSGITAESDPTVGSHIKAISTTNIADWTASYRSAAAVKAALQSLTGTARLDASAIQNLPTGGGGGITAETDPLVPTYVKSITQTQINNWDFAATQGGGSGFNAALNYIQIGNGASGAATYESIVIGKNALYNATWKSGTVIGWGANSDQQGGVSIGEGASTTWLNTYGCFSGSDATAVGRWSKGYGWRTTALGAYAHAGAQSSTAIGAGSAALSTHSVAVGRGAYAGNHPDVGNAFVVDCVVMYMNNGWAHRYPAQPTAAMETEYSVPDHVPAASPVRIQGSDAYDASESPSDFNVAGGTLHVASGRGTGSGVSGNVEILTAPVQNLGQNTKNPYVSAARFDGSLTPADGTRFWLHDISSGTLKRVKIAPADGNGRRVLYVD